ncbi:MAG: hypothetical protein V4858_21745 [Pseudomonadota bacterium]
MTNSLELTNNTPANWKGDFTVQALELIRGIVEAVDTEFSVEAVAKLDKEISVHWLFANANYAPRLQDLVTEARAVHKWAHFTDAATDKQIAARLLKAFGLWNDPAPHDVCGSFRFLIRFLAAYGRFFFKADYARGRMRRPDADHVETQLP